MPPQLIIALLVIAAAAIFLQAFLKASPAHVAKKIKRIGFYVVIGLVIVLALVKLNWIIAAIAAIVAALPRLLPLLRFLPLIKWLQSRHKRQAGFNRSSAGSHQASSSKVSARYVTMTLNHHSGELEGEVTAGRFAGQRLSKMTMEAIVQLYDECLIEDSESAALVESYLDRIYGEAWREPQQQRTSPGKGGNMSRSEALEILGLNEKASKQDIIQAHRHLMQKMHPDRGGSGYLAAKINQAKEVLLEKSTQS